MKTAVNKNLVQKLPLININNEINTFNITLTTNQTSKGIFLLEREKDIIVSAKSTENVTLNFKPKSQITYNGLIKV